MPFMFAFEDEEDLWSSSGEEEKEMEEEADNEESSSTFEIKQSSVLSESSSMPVIRNAADKGYYLSYEKWNENYKLFVVI